MSAKQIPKFAIIFPLRFDFYEILKSLMLNTSITQWLHILSNNLIFIFPLAYFKFLVFFNFCILLLKVLQIRTPAATMLKRQFIKERKKKRNPSDPKRSLQHCNMLTLIRNEVLPPSPLPAVPPLQHANRTIIHAICARCSTYRTETCKFNYLKLSFISGIWLCRCVCMWIGMIKPYNR